MYYKINSTNEFIFNVNNTINTNLKEMFIKEYSVFTGFGKNVKDNPLFEVLRINELKLTAFDKPAFIYVLDSSDNSELIVGLKEDSTSDNYKDNLNTIKPVNGSFYYLPKGTLLSLKNTTILLVKETKSTSDLKNTKYVKYDFENKAVNNKETYDVLFSNFKFEVIKLNVNDYYTHYSNESSFELIYPLCDLKLKDGEAKKDELLYLDPNSKIIIAAKGEVLVIRSPKLYIGIDVGGTSMKGLVIDDKGNVVCQSKVSTMETKGNEHVTKGLKESADILCQKIDSKLNEFESLGIGFPGNISPVTGTVINANNLGVKEFRLREIAEEALGIKVITDNDANCAALGEYKFTQNRKYHDMTLVTLGTGLGSGIIIDGKLFRGGLKTTTELGHIRIKSEKNFKCTCGHYGCFESFTSLARIKYDTDNLKKDKSNGLSELISDKDLYVKIFQLANTNEAAKTYLFKYLNNLVLGLVTVANLLEPEVIVLGGGVTDSLEKYIPYIEKKLNKDKMGGNDAPFIKVRKAKLGNLAGGYGACALTMDEE